MSSSQPVVSPYDSISELFDNDRADFREQEEGYLSLLLSPLAPASTVLDLGCGTGRPIAERIVALGHEILGIDASRGMLKLAERRLPGQRFIMDRIEQVQFDESFDAIVCWDALFHIPRRSHAGIIRKIYGWLRPGGRFMASSGGLVDESKDGFTDMMFGQEFFYDSLTPEQMVETVKGAGFKILLAEMCEQPDGDRNKGKWATLAEKRSSAPL
ncbi:MAG: class I SAM-dependent methyltransferase [Elusimicrobia bacterium]|nr:class I SAM-dependent methyltransferase [Elusimicrobiota bacterium]